jgi:acylphosphatase
MRVTGRRFTIHGRVQGVFYRAWASEAARSLGLAGWVRNRSDGSVELAAWGPEEALDALYRRCLAGPPAARVERIDAEAAEGDPPPGFGTLPTA